MFGLGFGEVLIIFLFALIFIGPKKLPELARSLGKGLREFQNAKQGLLDQIHSPPESPSLRNSPLSNPSPLRPDLRTEGEDSEQKTASINNPDPSLQSSAESPSAKADLQVKE